MLKTKQSMWNEYVDLNVQYLSIDTIIDIFCNNDIDFVDKINDVVHDYYCKYNMMPELYNFNYMSNINHGQISLHDII
jgi:hypothetical protein